MLCYTTAKDVTPTTRILLRLRDVCINTEHTYAAEWCVLPEVCSGDSYRGFAENGSVIVNLTEEEEEKEEKERTR
jgi:hypothetical protein